MDNPLAQSNRISPTITTERLSAHDPIHRRRVILWSLLIIAALVIIGIVAWKLYQQKRSAEFQTAYMQQQSASNAQVLKAVAEEQGSAQSTPPADVKAFLTQSASLSPATQDSVSPADALVKTAARQKADQDAARAQYDKTH